MATEGTCYFDYEDLSKSYDFEDPDFDDNDNGVQFYGSTFKHFLTTRRIFPNYVHM